MNALVYMLDRGWKDRLMVCPNRTDTGVSDWQPSLFRFARELEVEVVTLHQAQETPGVVFISLEFDTIVRPTLFQSSRLYNIHFSALPAYKGMYTSALPILHGASRSGVTLHEIDAGIDTGPIIAQSNFDLPETCTARDLYFFYMEHGFTLFRQNLDRLVADEPPMSTAQPANGSSYFAKSEIDYSRIEINLRDTADGIIRQLRAFSFREYQLPIINGMRIGGWQILSERSCEKPGIVLERHADFLTLATIDYNVQLNRDRTWEWFEVSAESDTDGLDLAYIDVRDRNGWTPLIRAAWTGDALLCERLLDAGANPNITNQNGTTPLMYALASPDAAGGIRAAQVLLARGGDFGRFDRFGRDLASYYPVAVTALEGTTQ